MVRIRILCGKIAARLRSMRASEGGGLILVATAILLASWVSLGEGRDDGTGASSEARTRPPGLAAEPASSGPAGAAATSRAETIVAGDGSPEDSPRRSGDHPANLLALAPSARSALVFDLKANRLHVFERRGGRLARVGDVFVAVGKNGLEKRVEGDEKTPLGIYFITSHIPGTRLPAIYGEGAFPLDYPNAWDRRLGRTGSGIWIHGTDKDAESLLPLSSRGCLTLHNGDFLDMARRVGIRKTPVIVSSAVDWVSRAELRAERDSLAAAVEIWRQDWESLETDHYLEHYSRAFRTDSMDVRRWRAHKRRVNAAKSYIRVEIDDLGIYAYPDEPGLFLVTFRQTYASNNFQGRKWKQQYWRRESGDWRIVHEAGA